MFIRNVATQNVAELNIGDIDKNYYTESILYLPLIPAVFPKWAIGFNR